MKAQSRRQFLKKSALSSTIAPFIPNFLQGKNIIVPGGQLSDEVLGHGDFKYKVDRSWGNLDPNKTPVKNCHEMVMDSAGRLFMVTDETANNMLTKLR